MPTEADITPYQAHLAAWREARDLTLEQVAEMLQIAHTTVARWESGQHPISSRRLADLCRVYQVTPTQLLQAPAEAAAVQRLDELGALTAGIADADFDHLRYVASLIKRGS